MQKLTCYKAKYRQISYYFVIYNLWGHCPANIYLFKVKNRNTRKKCEIFLKLIIKTPEQRRWRRSGVFIVNFENISHLFLLFLLLTLNKQMLARWNILDILCDIYLSSQHLLVQSSNGNTRMLCEICWKSTVMTPERRHWRRKISLIRFQKFFWYFQCWLRTSSFQLSD